MAVLPDADRVTVWADLMRDNANPLGALTKSDIRAAINAIDDFLETNSATINLAFPQPSRSELTSAQKAMVVAYVALKRWG